MKTLLTLITTALLASPAISGTTIADSTVKSEIELTESLIDAVNQIDMVSLNILLAEGADIDTTDADGNTPLMLASKIGNPRIVRIILAHDPDIHAKNNRGETALMIAAENGQYYIAQQLVEKGAGLREKNAAGFTAHELAVRNGHSRIAKILRDQQGEMPLSK